MLRPVDIEALDIAWIRWVCGRLMEGTGIQLLWVRTETRDTTILGRRYEVAMSYCGWKIRERFVVSDDDYHSCKYVLLMVNELYRLTYSISAEMAKRRIRHV